MRAAEPVGELDARFSSEGAAPTEWTEAYGRLEDAEIFWISTVRGDGRPHVTPLIAVLVDGSLFFCTGPDEQKARNLEGNRHCILTTGCNDIDEGLDVVVEGDAVRVTDEAALQRVAELYESKYGPEWHFDVRDGAFSHSAGTGIALVFEVAPRKAFGFRRGDQFSQTRWRFPGS
jgi:nitroimidazol reductase NimA-like FMN-containing flavoprotein (pyridoxamine 5'-phosphate oxidase superfamily)